MIYIILKKFLFFVLCSLTILIIGCIDNELQETEIPIWNSTDIEIEKLEPETPIYVYTQKVNKNSLFSKDIEFEVGYPPGGIPGYMYSSERPLYYDFGSYITFFIYKGTIIIGAQTYNKEKDLIAEAEVHYFITKENEQGIELKEIHYADGKPIFKCKSLIDPYTGDKIKQIDEKGRKTRDYYSIWPVI